MIAAYRGAFAIYDAEAVAAGIQEDFDHMTAVPLQRDQRMAPRRPGGDDISSATGARKAESCALDRDEAAAGYYLACYRRQLIPLEAAFSSAHQRRRLGNPPPHIWRERAANTLARQPPPKGAKPP